MKTLLVLAAHPDFAEAIRAGVNPEHYRVIARTGLNEAEPLLEHGLAEACIVDVELTGVQEIWFLEKLRRKAPRCPVIIYTGAKQSEWEEEAYLQGVTHVLTKPVRGRMLTALLDRLWLAPAAARPTQPPPPPLPPETVKSADVGMAPAAAQTLGVLRDFSGILTHSLNAEGMLKQFLLLLREILSINRAAIFLRQPFASFGNAPRWRKAAGCARLAPSACRPACCSISSCLSRPGLAGTSFASAASCGGPAKKPARRRNPEGIRVARRAGGRAHPGPGDGSGGGGL